MTGTSAFYDLSVTNTSANGTTSRSVTFGSDLSVTNTFTMIASTSAAFIAGATSTFQNVDWQGNSVSPVWLRSTATGTTWYLDIPGTQLNVDYVNVQDSTASSTVTTTNSYDLGNNINWTFGVVAASIGSSTIADHDDTQINNAFDFKNKTNEALFAFKLTPDLVNSDVTVTDLVITLSGAKKIDTTDFTNIRLYRDHNNDALYDASDEQVGGAGVMALSDRDGSITFSTDFLSTTTENFVIIADWNAPDNGSFLNMSLLTSGLIVTDVEGGQSVLGSVNTIQHSRNNKGGGGSAAAIDLVAPPGRSIETGGTNEGGDLISDNPDYSKYRWPTAHSGYWTNGANAFDKVDGTYASDAGVATSTYSDHGFVVASANSVTGIEMKLEVSGTTAAGTINVELSWDAGATWTAVKTTPTLTTTDTVVTLGGSADNWGRAWAPSEFTNANFAVRITANSSSNTVQVDALQVRVYHAETGGGASGGGGSAAI